MRAAAWQVFDRPSPTRACRIIPAEDGIVNLYIGRAAVPLGSHAQRHGATN
jgi:hypothetical protein